jgi:fibronectin type 3 domain-containing protein
MSGASFPLTLNPNQTATLNVQFDPATAGSANGTVTIVSTSSTNPTATIALSGTGATAGYEVTLSWDAPASSPDPVAGYIIYRSPSGESSYVQVNSSVVTQTSFTDTSVQPGQAYDYVVNSVDASGAESGPSNIASANIP